jgi:hypothetical protein
VITNLDESYASFSALCEVEVGKAFKYRGVCLILTALHVKVDVVENPVAFTNTSEQSTVKSRTSQTDGLMKPTIFGG